MASTQPAVGFSSETFEFRSKFPELHMPAYPVDDPALVDPTDPSHLVDGEFVTLTSDRKVRKLVAADLPGGGSPINQGQIWQVHGRPGRTDLQFGQYPVVMDLNYEFSYACLDSTALGAGDYDDGVYLRVAIVDLPKAGTAGLVLASSGEYFHAVCVGPANAKGYIRAFRKEGVMP